MTELPDKIESSKDVQSLVDWCLANIGLGYHPDTDGGEYVNIETGQRTFDVPMQAKLDRLHEQAARFGDLIYAYGHERQYELLNGVPYPALPPP